VAAFFPLGLTSTTPLRLTAKAASATNSQQRVLPMVWLTVPTVSAAAAAVAVAAAADLVTVFERCLEWMSAVISLFCAFLAVWPCAVLAYGYV
jgi:cytosine/uracil/thiamine/allantoin permease